MIKFLASMAVIAVSWVAGAWLLMVIVGVVHAEWIPQLPTIGYAFALLFSSLLLVRGAIGGVFSGAVKAIIGDKS